MTSTKKSSFRENNVLFWKLQNEKIARMNSILLTEEETISRRNYKYKKLLTEENINRINY